MVYFINTVLGTFCFDDTETKNISEKIKYILHEEKIICPFQFQIQNVQSFNGNNPKNSNNFKIGLNNFEHYIFQKQDSLFYHENYNSTSKIYYGLCKKPSQVFLDSVKHIGETITFNTVPKYLYLRLFMLNECDETKIDYNNIYHVFSIVIIFVNDKIDKIIFLDTHTTKNYIDQIEFFKAIYDIFPQKDLFPEEIKLENINTSKRRKLRDVHDWETKVKKYLYFPYDEALEELWIEQKESLKEQLSQLEKNIEIYATRNNWSLEKKNEVYIFESEKYLESEKNRYKNFYKNLQSSEELFLGKGEGFCNAWSLYFFYHATLFLKMNANTDNISDKLSKLYKFIYKKLILYNKLILFIIINKFWIDILYLHNAISARKNDSIMTNLYSLNLENLVPTDRNDLFLNSCYFDIGLDDYNKIII